ncbi:MAG: hypothetical protein AAGD05_09690 [Bacteroidota bacterium]
MKNSVLLSLILVFLLSACSKEEEVIVVPPAEPVFPEHLLNLSELKAGQRSVYVKYETKCENQLQNFTYTGDTLIIEVIEKDGQLAFQESYSPGSPIYQSNPYYQDPKIYPVEQQGELIFLRDRANSDLFFFYGNDTLQVNPAHDVALEQYGCLLLQENTPFIGNDIAQLGRFQVGDIVQTNKTAVSCVPIIDLDAYLIYDQNQLYQSHTINIVEFNGEILEDWISGWVLLEE